ncbi:uncharacterized protein TNCV_3092601 [Trichonephila clavipes]|uniref:Uncharacterized protein n=1 Tax=Trichonephila clavipes TaxID=2585209 RepID=A0A8X6V8V2_TRICX|nr:uncharacterized protein TNCV_3092601 [Trichonephila clavipes]
MPSTTKEKSSSSIFTFFIDSVFEIEALCSIPHVQKSFLSSTNIQWTLPEFNSSSASLPPSRSLLGPRQCQQQALHKKFLLHPSSRILSKRKGKPYPLLYEKTTSIHIYDFLSPKRVEIFRLADDFPHCDFRASKSDPVNDETDEDEDNESSKGPSNAGTFSALETAMEWYEQQSVCCLTQLPLIKRIRDFAAKKRSCTTAQRKIRDYFPN